MDENRIADVLVTAAIKVHKELGPGLLESVYEAVLAHELRKHGLNPVRQAPIPIRYEGMEFKEGFRADLLVNSRVIVELKCVSRLENAHKKQLLTYLRLSDCRLGFLFNFHSGLLKEGIIRIANAL